MQPIGVRACEPAAGGAVGEHVDQQLLARPLSDLAREPVGGFDAGSDQRLLVGVERSDPAFGVVRVADQQRVQREQQLGLVRGHAGGVDDVPRADDVAAGMADLDAAGAGDQRGERVVVAGALGVAVLVGGGGAVENERAAALGDVAEAERVGQYGLSAAGWADDQRDPAGVDRVERVCALDRSTGVRGADDHPAGRPATA